MLHTRVNSTVCAAAAASEDEQQLVSNLTTALGSTAMAVDTASESPQQPAAPEQGTSEAAGPDAAHGAAPAPAAPQVRPGVLSVQSHKRVHVLLPCSKHHAQATLRMTGLAERLPVLGIW